MLKSNKLNIMLAASPSGMTKVSAVILIMSLIIISSCLYDKTPGKEISFTTNSPDSRDPSHPSKHTDSNSGSQTDSRLNHDDLLTRLKNSNFCFENYSEVTTFSTDSTIKHLQSLSADHIEVNLIENLESMDLACYPTLTLHFEACPSFELVTELPFNNLAFRKASPDGNDTYNFSVFCSKSQDGLNNLLLDEYNDGFSGPAGLQLCFSSDFKVLYMGIVEENSGNTELYLVDLMNCSVIEKKRYNSLIFNVIKSGPYKDHLLTRDYSITGYGNYEILTKDGLVASALGRYSVYNSLTDDQSLVNESDPANDKISPVDTCYYLIKAKDTFASLADYYYGTDKEADELEKLNPEVDPGRLKIGQKIRVPCSPEQIKHY